MSHADTLRGMASDERILAGRENARSTALLAGADALDTRAHAVIAQAEQIETLSRLLAEAEEAAIERAAQIERVRDAYEHAHTLITEALEGDT